MLNKFFRKSYDVGDKVKKYGKPGRSTDDKIIRCVRFSSRVTEATDTQSEYIIFIALPLLQWLRERASV